jgi:type VI secretion system secreted protein Hcp
MIKMSRLTKLKKIIVILSTFILFFALPFSAFADTGLVLNGIQGEGNTGGPGAINVMSISFGAFVPQSSGSVISSGKPQYSDISIMKSMDKSTLPILMHLLTGKPITDGTLYFQITGGVNKPLTYLKINFKNIIITSYNLSASSERPTESISFKVQQMDFEYTVFKSDGTPGQTQKLSIDEAQNIVKLF